MFQPEGLHLSWYLRYLDRKRWLLGDRDSEKRWKAYLQNLKDRYRVAPDTISLQAVANIAKVTIIVLLPDGSRHAIKPFPPAISSADLMLGHVTRRQFIALQEMGEFTIPSILILIIWHDIKPSIKCI